MSYKITIVVPVYNAEQYINKCVESLKKQTLSDIQIILVDDGSKDASGRICDNFAAGDKRIQVIHKENGGVSSARNLGIQTAQGEYIGFVDADDWVDPEMFAALYSSAGSHDADISMCDAVTEYLGDRQETDTIKRLAGDSVLQKGDFSPELLMEMAGSACRCIYRSALIQRHGLKFSMALKFSEDRVFNIYAMGYANKVVYSKRAYYHRLIESGSAVHRFHADYYEAVQRAAAATEEALKKAWENSPAYQSAYKKQFVDGAIAAINNYFYKTSPLSHRERRDKLRELCADKNLREAIQTSRYGGIRGNWILNKRIGFLSACAKYLDWKYGR